MTLKNRVGKFILTLCLVVFLGIATYSHAGDKIKVGVIGPMKLLIGEHQWMGAQLAAEEINNSGGIQVGSKTYMIDLVKVDDNNILSVSDAVSAIERAITVEKVDFLTGGGRSEAMLAEQEVMADHKTIYLNTSSGSLEMNKRIAKNYERYKYWFRLGMFNAKYTGALIFANIELAARKIREQMGIQTPKVAVLAEKAMWADGIIRAAKAKLPKMGMEFVGAWRPSPTATDTTAELLAIKNAGAHIILTVGGGAVDTVWSKQYGELQIPAAMIGMGTDSVRKEFWKTSHGNCNYLVISSYLARLPGKHMFDDFSKKFGTDPVFHALTYDALYVLKDSLERAGTLDTDAVIDALEKTDYQSFRGRIAFYPNDSPLPHDLRWGPDYATGFGLQWQNGELAIVWPEGKSVLGDERWKGIKYPGTKEFILPPRMIEYWKDKK